MSPLKLNSLLTGVFLAIIVMLGNFALAQDGLRLWKPYSSESFGGARHSNDGVYGSVSGIYWSFSAPDGGYVGATTVKGVDETRVAYDGAKVYTQTNSVKIGMMDTSTTLGTRFEVGNRRGHHGWLISGYGLPRQSHTMNVQNMTMAIRDEGNLKYQPYAFGDGFAFYPGTLQVAENVYLWNRDTNSLYDKNGKLGAPIQTTNGPQEIAGLGYLWGYFDYTGGSGSTTGGDEFFLNDYGVFAPLPIWFKNSEISVSTTNRSAELMYTYRAHPFTWGSMELLAGARYWDFDDSFRFFGSGPGDTTSTDTSDITGDANGNNYTSYGPAAVLADMTINARAINRVLGPQFGIKLSRQNARWTFGAEGRFTAGLNAQSLKTQGYLASNYDYNANYHYRLGEGQVSWVPVGLQHNNTNFGHKQNKTYFSPILELRLSADWQWTSAVSFFGAFDTMYAGNIARGVRITDYVVKSDSTIFGIRGNDRNANVMVYGVEMGIRIQR